MEKQQKVVILYKKRSCIQNLMAALDFIQLNLTGIYKNTFKIVIPFSIILALVFGIFVGGDFNTLNNLDSSYMESMTGMMILFFFLYIINFSLVITVIGYIFRYYNQHGNTKKFQWSNMEGFLPRFIKVTIICILSILSFALGAGLFTWLAEEKSIIGIILMLIIFFIITPALSLIIYPALLGDCDVFKSITKGIKLGFKHWGSIFVTSIVSFSIVTIVSYFFIFILLIFTALLFAASSSSGVYLSLFVGNIISYMSIPLIIICFAFQYFSAVEATEGISLKQKIDDFENL